MTMGFDFWIIGAFMSGWALGVGIQCALRLVKAVGDTGTGGDL